MHLFKNESISKKITAIIMMVCLVAILSTTLALVIFHGITFGRATVNGLMADTALIAENCKHGLALKAKEDIGRVLNSLRTKPAVVFAGVYNTDAELLISYMRPKNAFLISPLKLKPDGWYLSNGFFTVYRSISLEHKKVGTLCIQSELKPFYQLLGLSILYVLGVLAGCYILTYALTKRLQYIISGPLLELNEAAQAVSYGKDYTVRVPKNNHDEVGVLIDSFNNMLEQIEARDDELTEKNAILATQISERKEAQRRFEQAHQQLLAASRRAGMAEVATDVLHNVGNVLNSLNLTTEMINTKLKQSKLSKLAQVGQMLANHREHLAHYLTMDEKGKHIPIYIEQVIPVLLEEQAYLVKKAGDLESNVNHIKDVVHTQQSYAKSAGLEMETTLNQLIDNAIQINSNSLNSYHVQLTKRIEFTEQIIVDQQRLLQILVNLISNAIYATIDKNKGEKCITIIASIHEEDHYRIEVQDNGVGIPPENLMKIFQHGFTTRDHGHGFGLHGSAIAAKELGGELTVASDGWGQGATFIVELPLKRVENQNETKRLIAY